MSCLLGVFAVGLTFMHRPRIDNHDSKVLPLILCGFQDTFHERRPREGQDRISILDLADGEFFYHLSCERDTVPDKVVYPLAEKVASLAEEGRA